MINDNFNIKKTPYKAKVLITLVISIILVLFLSLKKVNIYLKAYALKEDKGYVTPLNNVCFYQGKKVKTINKELDLNRYKEFIELDCIDKQINLLDYFLKKEE